MVVLVLLVLLDGILGVVVGIIGCFPLGFLTQSPRQKRKENER